MKIPRLTLKQADKIFNSNSEPECVEGEEVCPSCGGQGVGMWLALGFPVCMNCGGSGKIKK